MTKCKGFIKCSDICGMTVNKKSITIFIRNNNYICFDPNDMFYGSTGGEFITDDGDMNELGIYIANNPKAYIFVAPHGSKVPKIEVKKVEIL